MAGKNYFISGITDMLVLYFLNQKDCYVYEITKAVSELSEGSLNLNQNTIYTATYKLEKEGMISEYSKLVGRKRTRVYYHLETPGKEYLEELLTSYRLTSASIDKILGKEIRNDAPEFESASSAEEEVFDSVACPAPSHA
ncbi:MAG: helix-turn-helix transcriptional regulator [Lachnospiraceae bacterium]|nr:helix-turn-helix transcriptional regulator [Lachnospiraceae bacterium]